VQQNAAMVEEATAAANGLKSETGALTNLVRRFRLSETAGAAGESAREVQANSGQSASRPLRRSRSA